MSGEGSEGVQDLTPFPEADCVNCWKVKICAIVGQVPYCPFFEHITKKPVKKDEAEAVRVDKRRLVQQ